MSNGVMSGMNDVVVIYLILLAHVDIVRRGVPGAVDAPRPWELARQID
jgi:hypothetical protein